jgi:hypothetical protein
MPLKWLNTSPARFRLFVFLVVIAISSLGVLQIFSATHGGTQWQESGSKQITHLYHAARELSSCGWFLQVYHADGAGLSIYITAVVRFGFGGFSNPADCF